LAAAWLPDQQARVIKACVDENLVAKDIVFETSPFKRTKTVNDKGPC